ncbi:U3 small nucleolar ribonucleoprotein protein MPP10 [Toxorhynchites rutilus septentrionalis]|uniref:U3 small nucleolar ribonucleoprotein protein MPP10 n=1 Tax=Toxorhynchites rutilus septentrionalis TaxID=329112 RepID=UPI002479DF8C|nr:U3 small nucleolar ribonucleoprotein protein MPP10 [Toxorhynchites rutilus septentrionalis]
MGKTVNGNRASKTGLKMSLKKFREHTKNPAIFLSVQSSQAENIKSLIKSLYDHGHNLNLNKDNQKSYLDELVVDEMDEEQIWQQLELKNEQLLEGDLSKTSKLLSMGSKPMLLPFREECDSGDQEDESEDETVDNTESRAAVKGARKKKDSKKETKQNKRTKGSVIDDQFFRLEDMNKFLDEEDEREMRRQSGKPDLNPLVDIDYFSEHIGEDESSDAEIKYSDFFDDDGNYEDDDSADGNDQSNDDDEDTSEDDMEDKNAELEENGSPMNESEEDNSEDEVERNRQLRFQLYNNSEFCLPENESMKTPVTQAEAPNEKVEDEKMEEEEENANNGSKSSFELRQEKLQQRILKMEDQLLKEKPWQLKGEISADTRPQNSLLEEILEFESTTRPAPVITEETTMRLEDIIKQRIRNKAFDDVERMIRPPDNPKEYRKQVVLDAEKSKESLAQIYEKDYLKQLEKANPDADQAEEEEPKEHKQIRNMMKTLLAQLDALSNFHYTPRPAVPELKIVTNTPAINMEEVAPVATSDAALLAPEEVHNRPKGDVMSKDERTKTDKNRERRLKKRFQRDKFERQNEKEQKLLEKGLASKSKELQGKLLKKVTKAKNVSAMSESNSVSKSSAAFFNRLQDEVSTQIKGKQDPSSKKSKKNTDGIRATHIKL